MSETMKAVVVHTLDLTAPVVEYLASKVSLVS